MRIIHTSDWHLGQHFYGKSRAREHQHFLNWLVEQSQSQQIDAIVVAGDIFDTGTPPSYAREMYFDFIAKLHQVQCQLVVLAGNHDSVAMLSESQNLLQQLLLSDVDRMQDDQPSSAKVHPVLRDFPYFELTLIDNFEQDVAVSYLRGWLAQYVDILPSAIQMQTVYVDMVLSKQDSEPSFVWSQAGLYRYNSRLYLISRQMINRLNDQPSLNEVYLWQGDELHCFAGTLSQTIVYIRSAKKISEENILIVI